MAISVQGRELPGQYSLTYLIKRHNRPRNQTDRAPDILGCADLSGYWSRHIDDTNCLVYRIQNGIIDFYAFRTH
ncbi:type II toxin-antitoxin system YoeB family toxin [Paenibacillus sp. FA6]|uniref:type II toxin-antitoxin system YoeB family toxin n=1 Tax=Paenibacillus sp. FA6 TaxID=3413029 RepID=UPI003F65A240